MTDTDKINNMFLRALGRKQPKRSQRAVIFEALIRDIEEQEAEIVKLNEFLDTASKQKESILAPIRQRLTEAAMKDNNPKASFLNPCMPGISVKVKRGHRSDQWSQTRFDQRYPHRRRCFNS